MRITKNQLKHIIQEELAQVVSERDQSTVRFPGVASVFNKGGRYNKTPYTPPTPAADLRTSEPALPDEQYLTSPGEYSQDEFSSMTSIPVGAPGGATPEQDAYARKLFGMPEPAAPAAKQGDAYAYARKLVGMPEPAAPEAKQGDAFMANLGLANEFPAAPTVFQGKKGDPYEYKEVNGQYQARKKGSEKWNSVKKGSKAHKSIASVQGGGKSLYKDPKKRNIGPEFVAGQKAALKRGIESEKGASAPVSAKQQKRNSLADAFEKAQRAKDGKGILTPKAQAKAVKIRKRGKKLNPFD